MMHAIKSTNYLDKYIQPLSYHPNSHILSPSQPILIVSPSSLLILILSLHLINSQFHPRGLKLQCYGPPHYGNACPLHQARKIIAYSGNCRQRLTCRCPECCSRVNSTTKSQPNLLVSLHISTISCSNTSKFRDKEKRNERILKGKLGFIHCTTTRLYWSNSLC